MGSTSRNVRLRLFKLCGIDPCHFSAHDVALSKQHKSISASDVLKALEMIEFGDLVDPLQNELQSNLNLLLPFGVSQLPDSLQGQHKGRQEPKECPGSQ